MDAPTAARNPAASDSQPLPGHRNPLRILLAEDNSVNRDLCLHLLADLGWNADTAANGREALEKISTAHPPYDLVLMDVRMPEMDGFETTLRIINRFPDPTSRPRIIAVTANALKEDRRRCLAAGMDEYLSKPLRRRDLEQAIFRTVLGMEPPGSDHANPSNQTPPTTEATPDAPVDLAQFDMIVTDPDSPCVALFHEFLDNVPQALAAIQVYAAQKNVDAVASKAHQFKGSSITFGMFRFSNLMAATENHARGGGSLDQIASPEWIQHASALFAESREFIRQSRGI